MKHKKTTLSLGTILFFFICILLGGMLGMSISVSFGEELSWWQLGGRLVEGLFIFCLAFFLQVILHEAGHMIAGLVRGWSFISFMILGIVLSRKNNHFHFSRFAIPGVGGQCLMMPPEEGDSNFGIALYNAGGVVMNVVIALFSVILLIIYGGDLWWNVRILLYSLFITGLFFTLTNGIPAYHGGIPNDGMNMRELKKDAFSTSVFLASMRVLGKLQQGICIEQITDRYLTDEVTIDYSNPIHVMAVNYDISLAIAQFDFEKAHALFRKMKNREKEIVPIYQMEMLYEKVFLFLVSPRDGVDVGVLIDSETLSYFEMQTNFRPTALRVKYTFARLYECDEAKAAVIYEQFQRVCDSYHMVGEIHTEKKLVEYVKTLEPADS